MDAKTQKLKEQTESRDREGNLCSEHDGFRKLPNGMGVRTGLVFFPQCSFAGVVRIEAPPLGNACKLPSRQLGWHRSRSEDDSPFGREPMNSMGKGVCDSQNREPTQ